MNDKIKELAKLSEENPDLEIVMLTYYDVVADDYGYWKGKISNVKTDFIGEIAGRVCVGLDQMYDFLNETLLETLQYDSLSDEEYDIIINGEISKGMADGRITKVILIYIDI